MLHHLLCVSLHLDTGHILTCTALPPSPAQPPKAHSECPSSANVAGAGERAVSSGVAAAAAPPAQPQADSLQAAGCARAAPYDAASRRGLRAPDQAAIAIAKRSYLRKVFRLSQAVQGINLAQIACGLF